MNRKAILILGMHRSGTSMLAGLLNHNGYDIGPNVMPAQPDNPKGFFENTSVCILNERILQEMDSCWDDLTLDIVRQSEVIRDRYLQDVVEVIQDQFSAADQFLIKDPRLCLLYPIWASALHELEIGHGTIIQYRNPFAVARSLHARDKFPLNKGLQLWCNHMLSAESLTRNACRAFIDHAALLKNPAVQLQNLLSQIGWPVNDITSMDTSLVDSTLSHHQEAGDDIGMHLPQPVLDLIDLIRNADFSRDTAFDRISEQLGTYRDFFVHRDTQYTTRNRKAEKILNRDLEWFRKHFQEKSQELNQMKSEASNLGMQLQESIRNSTHEIEVCEQAQTDHRSLRLLVACNHMVPSGGLLRFERVARVIRGDGHLLAFTPLADRKSSRSDFSSPVISLAEASKQHWDAVMIPGAGFPTETIEQFSLFRADNFGLRIQHVLNDQTKRSDFIAVNQSFSPDLVVFNNNQWPVGSFTEFSAHQFHYLFGGVDLQHFRPRADRNYTQRDGKWIIGGQSNKNPEPVIQALEYLDESVQVHLFGPVNQHLKTMYAEWIDAGRLQFTGLLTESQLADFYGGVDCIVMSATFAGWANIAAEALACGVPLICTPHGTGPFAWHDKTALVIDTPDPVTIADAVKQLISDPGLCRRLAGHGRAIISEFSWDNYARSLLALLNHDGRKDYIWAPESGLHGKWPKEDRLSGLEPLLARSQGLTVLDLGAAEGIIGMEFLNRGASLVHGFEINEDRVHTANELCAGSPECQFWKADLSDWGKFEELYAARLLKRYDIVLYLGLQQHLPTPERLTVFEQSLNLADKYFAYRSPAAVYAQDDINGRLQRAGFSPLDSTTRDRDKHYLGQCQIYQRVRTS